MEPTEIDCPDCDGTGIALDTHNSVAPKDVPFCKTCNGKPVYKPGICNECQCVTYKILPHPSGEDAGVCEDCEYAITCTLESNTDKPLKNYADRRGE